MKKSDLRVPAMADPLSALLPNEIYQKILELRYPHVPLVGIIDRAVAMMTPEDKAYTRERVKQVKEYVDVVEKAVR